MSEPGPDSSSAGGAPADIGAGDPDPTAGAIPSLIAGLVETETWRDAATVLLGALLIGLGIWAYSGVRTSLAQARGASLEALDALIASCLKKDRARTPAAAGADVAQAKSGE